MVKLFVLRFPQCHFHTLKNKKETTNAFNLHRLKEALGPSLEYSFHFSQSDLIYVGLDSAVRHRPVFQTVLGCTSNYFLVVRDAVCPYLKEITRSSHVALHVGEVLYMQQIRLMFAMVP